MSYRVQDESGRVESVDFLRGMVMIIMLLDHVREYVHAEAFASSPTDLAKTTVPLFLTRWMTHLCAPTFVLLAGTSVFLQRSRGGKPPWVLTKFLLTRGLWLIVLEFTVVRFSLYFNLDYIFFGMAEVIWALGVSMMVLAVLLHGPLRLTAAIGVGIIVLHNLLDPLAVPPEISMAGLQSPSALQVFWMFLHQPGFVPLAPSVKMFVAYPLLPWIGVMAVGYALGQVYVWERQRRRTFLFRLGGGLTLLFVALRATNLYGDPHGWSRQDSPIFTVLSFLNTTKYPASLLFLLMTLGPALLILGWSETLRSDHLPTRAVITFGRVPLFYFVLQMFLAHLMGIALSLLAGKSTDFYYLNFPASSTQAPPDAGFPLWVVYLCWIVGLALLYPPCCWYAKLKAGKRGFPFSYL